MSVYKKLKTKFRVAKLTYRLKKRNVFFEDHYNYSKTNVLIVDEMIPEYNKDSGSRRLKTIITLLLKNDIGVFLLADLKQYRYRSEYIEYYKSLGVNAYTPSIYNGKLLSIDRFIEYIAPRLDYAWLHRPVIFDRFYKRVKQANPSIKLIYDMVDFHYIRFQREYELYKDDKYKALADRHLKIEVNSCKLADTVIAISQTDKKLLLNYYNSPEKIEVISNIHQFQEKKSDFQPFTSRKGLLFVGNFRHTPNTDAVNFLIQEIMPLVWKTHPDIILNIVGSHQTEAIKNLNSEKIVVHGFVDDITDFFKTVRIFVAPLRYGAGIKGKIGQSFEHSLPLVTTSIGAEGFDFGEHQNTMVADTAEDYAKKLIQLYTNETLWNSVSDYSETILQPFSLAHTEREILSILKN